LNTSDQYITEKYVEGGPKSGPISALIT